MDDSGAEKTLVEDEELKPKRVRAKLLQFTENQRPPYWGTWTKKSKFVGPRKPFGRDKELFDYEYDSGNQFNRKYFCLNFGLRFHFDSFTFVNY